MKNIMVILLISTKKLYFTDDDTIYDVIMQVPIKKLRRNYGNEISNDPFAEFSLSDPFVALARYNHIKILIS